MQPNINQDPMKNKGRNKKTPLTMAQFHAVIRQRAITSAMAIPETDEEFALLEKSLAILKLPDHNFEDVLKIIETGENPEPKMIVFPPAANESLVEELAQAARHGTKIPPEIKEIMEADRNTAEKDRRMK